MVFSGNKIRRSCKADDKGLNKGMKQTNSSKQFSLENKDLRRHKMMFL